MDFEHFPPRLHMCVDYIGYLEARHNATCSVNLKEILHAAIPSYPWSASVHIAVQAVRLMLLTGVPYTAPRYIYACSRQKSIPKIYLAHARNYWKASP